jgi:predicted dithiol-disulfide oxidoreductase (DUF899 family)
MALPDVVSHEDWLSARTELLAREKELTRLRDRLVADRRRLPMEKIEKDYRFTGPDGERSLEDLFDGRRQLIVVHFMFDPEWEEGCSSCTAGADEMSSGHLEHLRARDTTLVYVSRAPYDKLAAYRAKRGWSFPWYSSHGSEFNYDFAVTLDESMTPPSYNYRSAAELREMGFEPAGEFPGRSAFLRTDDGVFHTYSVYARGTETIGGSYYLLDETSLGRMSSRELLPHERRALGESVPSNSGARPDFS